MRKSDFIQLLHNFKLYLFDESFFYLLVLFCLLLFYYLFLLFIVSFHHWRGLFILIFQEVWILLFLLVILKRFKAVLFLLCVFILLCLDVLL